MKIFSRILVLALLAGISVSSLRSDELPRHGVIGLTVAPTDTTRPDDPQINPPTIRAVAPGSAGDAAGIQHGDIVRKLDGMLVASSTDFAGRITPHLAGDQVPILISRNGQELIKTATLKPRPYETNPDADVIFGSVIVDSARRRSMMPKPFVSRLTHTRNLQLPISLSSRFALRRAFFMAAPGNQARTKDTREKKQH